MTCCCIFKETVKAAKEMAYWLKRKKTLPKQIYTDDLSYYTEAEEELIKAVDKLEKKEDE